MWQKRSWSSTARDVRWRVLQVMKSIGIPTSIRGRIRRYRFLRLMEWRIGYIRRIYATWQSYSLIIRHSNTTAHPLHCFVLQRMMSTVVISWVTSQEKNTANKNGIWIAFWWCPLLKERGMDSSLLISPISSQWLKEESEPLRDLYRI